MEREFYFMLNIFLDFTVVLISILTMHIFSTIKSKRDALFQIVTGILFAIGTLVSMLHPLTITKGVFIDSRTVLINLPTMLFGEVAGLIPSFAAIMYRVYAGGAGETGGVLLIVCTYLISLYFYYKKQKNRKITLYQIFISSLIVHITMVALLLIFFYEFFFNLKAILLLLSIVVVYPAITTLLGSIILEAKKWQTLKKETEVRKNFFNTLLDSINEIVVSADTDNKIIFANKKAKKFFKNDKLENTSFKDLIQIYDEHFLPITDKIVEKAQSGENIKLQNCFVKKGVNFIPIEGLLSPLIEEGNEIKGILISFSDIGTKKKKEKLLSDILERISDGIESFDRNWNYTFANKQAVKLLKKKSVEEVIGKNKWKLEPEAMETPFYNACIEAQKTQKPVFMEHFFKPLGKWFENRIYPSKEGITVFFTDITEKKKLEEEINKINKQLKTILQLNSAIIFIWELESRKTLFVSENIESIIGYSKEEAMSDKWWRNIVHPEDLEEATIKSDAIYVDGITNQKFRIYKKDGSIAWIFEKQIMIEDKDTKTKIAYGIWIDITELITIEEKLKEQQRTFIHLFENKFVPMLLIDKEEFRIINANKAACILYGYSKKEFKKLSIEELHTEKPNIKQIMKNLDRGVFYETTHKKANGEKIFVELYGIPFVQNNREYIFVIVHDITDKKRIENELILSESKFFLTFNSSPIATAISDVSTGKLIDVNHAFEKLSGFSKSELIGKTTLELNLWQNPEKRKKIINRIKRDKKIINEKLTFRNKKGKRIHTLFTAFIFQKNSLFSYVIDISNLIKLQSELELKVRERTAKLEQLNEELKEFSRSIAHDLKEPVRTIKNFSELILKDNGLTEKETEKYLEFINTASQSIEIMINELYEYSKLEKTPFTLSKIPLDSILDNVLAMLDSKIKEKKAKITITDELGVVQGNNTLITKVFLNTLENALKFVKEGIHPEITINSKKTKSKITIEITDNGIGIRNEDLNKIFFPFVKLNRENEFEGTGMGLAIAKKAMELMGGTIEIKSELNKGTQVFLTFRI